MSLSLFFKKRKKVPYSFIGFFYLTLFMGFNLHCFAQNKQDLYTINGFTLRTFNYYHFIRPMSRLTHVLKEDSLTLDKNLLLSNEDSSILIATFIYKNKGLFNRNNGTRKDTLTYERTGYHIYNWGEINRLKNKRKNTNTHFIDDLSLWPNPINADCAVVFAPKDNLTIKGYRNYRAMFTYKYKRPFCEVYFLIRSDTLKRVVDSSIWNNSRKFIMKYKKINDLHLSTTR